LRAEKLGPRSYTEVRWYSEAEREMNKRNDIQRSNEETGQKEEYNLEKA
jgi:hypothetical protein